MKKLQIELTDEQWEQLEIISRENNLNIQNMISDGIEAWISSSGPIVTDPEERKKRFLSVIGKYKSGLIDVSTNHDKYLTEDF